MKTDNEKIQDQITLTKINGYAVESSDDEYRSSIKGYYSNYNDAMTKAKGSGWYGADGKVQDVVLHQDSKGNLYKVKSLGKFSDITEIEKNAMVASIQSKLTPAELAFLNIKIV